MNAEGLKKRHQRPDGGGGAAVPDGVGQSEKMAAGEMLHPGGPVKHGNYMQALRMFLFALYFFGSCCCILFSQLCGAWLYFADQDLYYAYMAVTKQNFGLLITTMTQWWSPTLVRVSGDASVRGQLHQLPDGRLECDFPSRLILVANHQIYTDWLYLWWVAYTARMHGHIYIILKESLRWIPVIGQGMMFYGFVFLSRKWATDKPRFMHRLRKLNSRHSGPMARAREEEEAAAEAEAEAAADPKADRGPRKPSLDPMWLLIFPEGTNLSANSRQASAKWAAKTAQEDMRHVLLPRSTGLMFCLEELKQTVEWVYDCTVAYEGIPRGQFGQDIFTLRSTYFEGRPPKSVNMHWRRFRTADIPSGDAPAFEAWLRARWREKDELMETYVRVGRFPADDGEDGPEAGPAGMNGEARANGGATGGPRAEKRGGKGAGYIETEVRPRNPVEVLQIFVPAVLGAWALVWVWRVVRALYAVYAFVFVRWFGLRG